jgi:hypothetical protein
MDQKLAQGLVDALRAAGTDFITYAVGATLGGRVVAS